MQHRTRHLTGTQPTIPRSTELVVLGLLAALCVWLVVSFAQEIYLNHRLNAQASAMVQQNQALQAENAGYRKDISAVASGASAEEDSRINGYARSDEKVYMVGAPPAPTQTPQQPKVTSSGASPVDGLGHWFQSHWPK